MIPLLRTRREGKRERRYWLVPGAVLVLLLVAIGIWWRAALLQREIVSAREALSGLQEWIDTAAALEPTIEHVGPELEARWSRLCPSSQQREELFLELARIADRSAVVGFELEEQTDPAEGYGADDGAPPPAATADPEIEDQLSSVLADAGVELNPPSLVLDSYRIKASFRGDYAAIIRFLEGLRSLDRLMAVRKLNIAPEDETLRVGMEMDVYVDGTSGS